MSSERANDRVTLSLSKGDEQPTFDAVVLAVPPRQVAKLLGDPARYGVHDLDAYEPYPIVDVHLWHDGGSIGLDFAAALDSPLQWIFEKVARLSVLQLQRGRQEYLTLPTAELEALAWREVQAFLPALQERKAHPQRRDAQSGSDVAAARRHARTAQATAHPAIAIAGSWTDTGWPDTMESAVRSGTAGRQASARRSPEVSVARREAIAQSRATTRRRAT